MSEMLKTREKLPISPILFAEVGKVACVSCPLFRKNICGGKASIEASCPPIAELGGGGGSVETGRSYGALLRDDTVGAVWANSAPKPIKPPVIMAKKPQKPPRRETAKRPPRTETMGEAVATMILGIFGVRHAMSPVRKK